MWNMKICGIGKTNDQKQQLKKLSIDKIEIIKDEDKGWVRRNLGLLVEGG